ncbi:MAG: DUF4286 family protein [Schleiferiaceae bacterium]|jgi:hypothetical protein|nr:DUF4286 family protein [Schleiferiaceae bacterium]MDP4627519.1 DUF4286 family protein [Schleiferiaceae bacterium]MDP4728388.1 DUF4286 family protein [Schleiferiaceae bacterium]MDP4749490.1 DUF4286 family protein [Schleiferiaceae bacterium]MDP4859274.1 DUF4286 family protein [Schleiferiaceae bacterium]
MYLYNVTVNIDDSAHALWKDWMLEVHIPEVLATGQFLDCRFTRVLVEEESGTTYSIQYRFALMEDFQLYQELYAPGLRRQTEERFGGKFVAFRTLLEIQNEFMAERLDG